MLTPAEKYRYARQLNLAAVGETGQEKLRNAKVLVIGCGGLGCPVLTYLAGSGTGTLGIVDHDTVDESNLHRQILFGTKDVGRKKADCAKEKLADQNPFICINAYPFALTAANARELISQYDIVVDGTDNFKTRYLINDACVLENKPLVYGAIYKFEGQVSVFNFNGGPTYRCLFPTEPDSGPDCREAGVLPVLPGIIGLFMTNEILKLILELDTLLTGKVMIYHALSNTTTFMNLDRLSSSNVLAIQAGIAGTGLCHYDNSGMEQIDELQFFELMKTDTVFLDVRESWEQPPVQCENLLQIPLDQIESRLGEIPAGKKIVVFCQSGGRSRIAIHLLAHVYGFNNLLNLEKGIHSFSSSL
ncbi:MAG: HesA/MoeB/ThiF family protein [Bacteroidetes bacterium]|nr:HesA/MoeB/ThiF family protein [Bacteroidota bacterium]